MTYTDKNEEEKRIAFNPNYLIDSLQFNETNIIKIKHPKAPAFIENKEKKTLALVLPVNIM